jgi:hypothetical protein
MFQDTISLAAMADALSRLSDYRVLRRLFLDFRSEHADAVRRRSVANSALPSAAVRCQTPDKRQIHCPATWIVDL